MKIKSNAIKEKINAKLEYNFKEIKEIINGMNSKDTREDRNIYVSYIMDLLRQRNKIKKQYR